MNTSIYAHRIQIDTIYTVLNYIILLVSQSLFCYRNAVGLTVTAGVIWTNSLQSISYCCKGKYIILCTGCVYVCVGVFLFSRKPEFYFWEFFSNFWKTLKARTNVLFKDSGPFLVNRYRLKIIFKLQWHYINVNLKVAVAHFN